MSDLPVRSTSLRVSCVWEKIFSSDGSSLTEAEQESAFQELAEAICTVEQRKTSPEHARVKAMISRRMN